MIMQDVWKLKEIDWNDEITGKVKSDWLKIYSNLPLLNEFKIKRWLHTGKNSKIQIHAFCDASEKAYGIAIYVRVVDDNGVTFCSLLSSKSRVAPIKQISIPRLELLAAVMLADQLEIILKTCEFNTSSVTLWSDSLIVLYWIKNQTNELKTFVSNRIKIIHEKTKHFQWKHVRSADNPADLVSRGLEVQDFLRSELWLYGPTWLKLCENQWPTTKLIVSAQEKEEILKECKTIKQIESKANILLFTDKRKSLLYDESDDFDKIINITAYVLRYIHNLGCMKYPNTPKIKGKYLKAFERTKAIEYWIKLEQKKAYAKEIQAIQNNDILPNKSKIKSLRPILVAGVLRVGGRLEKANMDYNGRHQYIIPSKSRLSYLLLKKAHYQTLHGGVQIMSNYLRSAYWIPKMRQEAKNHISKCVRCVRQAQTAAKQIMSGLPEVRITPAPPFQNVGIDMAGPYLLKASDKINLNTRSKSNLPEIKGWIAVFVCLVTRAVHLEATEGMSTDDFLAAYQNFVSRRGNPEKVYSDNGTNFVGTNNELKEAVDQWKQEKIQHYANVTGTEWHFITPSAPHEGGIWEAAVKQMKHHLLRVMGTQKYSYKSITNLLTSVEACLNSRPLCALSDDPDDIEALSPAHFLIGRKLRLPIHEMADKPPSTIRRLFKQRVFQINAFWKQWSNDYLHSLTQLPKWREMQKNIKVGQLVLIMSDNIAPTYWAMARVIEVHLGSDEKVRSVTLKTETGILTRSIRKLCVLPIDIEINAFYR